jgi:hypothetical protein
MKRKHQQILVGAAALLAVLAILYGYKIMISKYPNSLSSYPSISSTSTIQDCRSGACIMGSNGTSTTSSSAGSTSNLKKVMTTVFWVGEPSDADNDYIPNDVSAWDGHWQANYGGVDSGVCRKGYLPCTFTPKQNPFYFALPYNDLDADGKPKPSQKLVPWYTPTLAAKNLSILKNHWIKVVYGDKTCYAQWEDVGPNEEDDFSYVFGKTAPKNTFGEKAGLDLSPAMFTCLGLKDNAATYWAFVDEKAVPPGPWRDTETVSGVAW